MKVFSLIKGFNQPKNNYNMVGKGNYQSNRPSFTNLTSSSSHTSFFFSTTKNKFQRQFHTTQLLRDSKTSDDFLDSILEETLEQEKEKDKEFVKPKPHKGTSKIVGRDWASASCKNVKGAPLKYTQYTSQLPGVSVEVSPPPFSLFILIFLHNLIPSRNKKIVNILLLLSSGKLK